MSEIKGSLLTIIMVLVVFGTVFGLVVHAIQSKADEVSQKIEKTETESTYTPTGVSYLNI